MKRKNLTATFDDRRQRHDRFSDGGYWRWLARVPGAAMFPQMTLRKSRTSFIAS
jgi:hypothetical protein